MEDHIYAASTSSDEPSKTTSKPMKWTSTKDVMLAREIMVVDPFRYKKNTRERGKAWATVAENLVKHDEFKVEQRSVRDRYAHLKLKSEKRNRDEAKASGISPEVDELDVLIEELVSKDNDSENCTEASSEEIKRLNGVEMRKRALETFAETRERSKRDEKEPKKRKSGGETISYLVDKMNMEMEYKKKELENQAAQRRREEAESERRHEMLQQQLMQQNQSINNMMLMMMEIIKHK